MTPSYEPRSRGRGPGQPTRGPGGGGMGGGMGGMDPNVLFQMFMQQQAQGRGGGVAGGVHSSTTLLHPISISLNSSSHDFMANITPFRTPTQKKPPPPRILASQCCCNLSHTGRRVRMHRASIGFSPRHYP